MGDFRLARSLARALAGEVVRVGTENRAKLGAVRTALAGFANEASRILVQPVGVASGVPEQPIGWGEIVAGARNRARAAWESGDCALAVGIEDGLVRLNAGAAGAPEAGTGDYSEVYHSEVFNVGCAWITDGEREGHGFSSGFAYPAGCLEPAFREQVAIGDLFDRLWREKRPQVDASQIGRGPTASVPPAGGLGEGGIASGRSGGNIGLLTGGRLDRCDYGSQAVVCALVRFLHTDLYD